MSGGDVVKLVCQLVTEQVTEIDDVLDLPTKNTLDCCYQLEVLADNIGTNYYKNDQSSVFFQKGIITTDIVLYLQKNTSGSWSDVATLNDDSFGTFFPFGFYAVANAYNSIGYLINWHLVLVDVTKGAGSYRVRAGATVRGNLVNFYSCEYCLKEYKPELAYETIRFDYWMNGILGENENRTNCIDYGEDISTNNKGWFNQIRVPGVFGYEKRENEQTFRQFKNKSKQQLESISVPSFTAFLDVRRLPFWVHEKLMIMLQADLIQVTDYNQPTNPDNYIDFPVNSVGSYEPEYFRGRKESKVELTFEQKYNTFEKRVCR